MAEWVDYCPPVGFVQCGTDAPTLSADQLVDCTHWQPLPPPPQPLPSETK